MNSKQFCEFIIKKSIIKELTEVEKRRIEYFIDAVKEIEELNIELNGDIGPPYLKEFMLPEDYIKILRELKCLRSMKFCKLLIEKKKYLNKVELPKEEVDIICKEYEKGSC